MSNQEKLNTVIKLSQSYILLFLKEYIGVEQISSIEHLFKECPVFIEKINAQVNEFGKINNYGGYAQDNKIIINLADIEKVNIENEEELNKLLGIVIHEYAHKIRALNNKYGEMFEEGVASIFAEVCINNARLKLNNQKDNEVFQMLTSSYYQKAESQVRALLYILKQEGLDLQLVAKYIAQDQKNFEQTCINILGEKFGDYFTAINNGNKNTDQILIEIIIHYIKQKGLNISDYWNNKDNLYFKGSPILEKAIVNAGADSFKIEEQESYNTFIYAVKVNRENENLIDQEKVDRIRQFMETKFSLKGRSLEEIYETIIDLCSFYVQHQKRNDEESIIFMKELANMIPNMEEFKTKFITLRVLGKDKEIFDNMDLDNITYSDILLRMNELLQSKSLEEGMGR